jgi:hypothetical protein
MGGIHGEAEACTGDPCWRRCKRRETSSVQSIGLRLRRRLCVDAQLQCAFRTTPPRLESYWETSGQASGKCRKCAFAPVNIAIPQCLYQMPLVQP